jgi:uncharacterized membrane protein YdjX (TVP38/TMEM64 family)
MKRLVPLIIIFISAILFFSLGLQHYFSFAELKAHHNQLTAWTHAHFWQASFLFIATYISVVAISVPCASLLTLSGGFLFGVVIGTTYVVCSAMLGATIIFLAIKTVLGEPLAKKATPWLKKLESGLQKNAINYLLFLRLVPVFPFWLINIVTALFNVPLRLFIITTLLGIILGSLIYVVLGNGLDTLLMANQLPDLSFIFKPVILIPLIALAILSLTPLLFKRRKEL